MRAAGVIFRTPVVVETPGENLGDGPIYGEPRTVLAQVQQERVTSYDDTGQVRTKPMVLLLPHDDDVPVGARITVDGDTATVLKSKPVRGAYGVIHHREVTAQ